MYFSAEDFLQEWLGLYPGVYLPVSVLTTSVLESKFGQVRVH